MRPRIFRIWNIKPCYFVFTIDDKLSKDKIRPYGDWFGIGIKDVSFRKMMAYNQLKRFQARGAFDEPAEYHYAHWQENGKLHYELYKVPKGVPFIP